MAELKQNRILLMLTAALVVPAAALFFFGWLANEVLEARTQHLDAWGRTAVHRFAAPAFTETMRGISFCGSGAVLTGLTLMVVALLVYARQWRRATLITITRIGASLLDVALKNAFHRPRPVPFFVSASNSYSFPSGHALASLCFYATLAEILCSYAERRAKCAAVWTAAVLLIAAIGLSRICLGVHDPSDVIGGYLAAIAWVGLVRLAIRSKPNRPA